jgi:hypothetical protein
MPTPDMLAQDRLNHLGVEDRKPAVKLSAPVKQPDMPVADPGG